MRSGQRYADSVIVVVILTMAVETKNLVMQDEPGESLSDCDKDDADESMGEYIKDDEDDESEDGFFVPDGYLSENEVLFISPHHYACCTCVHCDQYILTILIV